MEAEDMSLKLAHLIALAFTALALATALAHLLALPNKIGLSAEDYLTVQRIYRGWALLSIFEVIALLGILVMAVKVGTGNESFHRILIALLCVTAALIVFFTATYPVNRQTSNWTMLPVNWQRLRLQWEYSHAIRAVLYGAAFFALALSFGAKNE
jgi:SNF family Na+-dependent transporter